VPRTIPEKNRLELRHARHVVKQPLANRAGGDRSRGCAVEDIDVVPADEDMAHNRINNRVLPDAADIRRNLRPSPHFRCADVGADKHRSRLVGHDVVTEPASRSNGPGTADQPAFDALILDGERPVRIVQIRRAIPLISE